MSVNYTPPIGPDGKPIQDDAFVAAQQAQFAAEQAAEAERVAKYAAEHPEDQSDDALRAKGWYFLNDPQWNPGGPWDGQGADGMETRESNRVAAIEEMVKAGTAEALVRDGQIVGYRHK